MSGGAAQLYEEDFVRSTEQQSRALLGPMIEKQKPRVARLATLSLFGYGETVKQLPLPSLATPRSKWSGPVPGGGPSPRGGEREELA
jgi:hypothetical protein